MGAFFVWEGWKTDSNIELKKLCGIISTIFEIDDISNLSEKLLSVCLNNQHQYMEKFADAVGDLSVDCLQKVFQYYEADRKEKKQDYTPTSLARFIGKLTESEQERTVYDLCAGTGALTIQKWNLNKKLMFICYEYDKKVIPLLLFNLAVRNIDAVVINGDALQDEIFAVYRIRRGAKYAAVYKQNNYCCSYTAYSCISNPPYNMKWKAPPFAEIQERFCECEMPPESNANYAFVLTALNNCTEKASLILPNAVLTTENKQEMAVRRYLVEKNLIESVVTCPDKMFESTAISVCIMTLNRHKDTTQIAFVDMRQTYEVGQREQKGQYGGTSHENRTYNKEFRFFSEEQMQKAIDSISHREAIPGFSKSVPSQAVMDNSCILAPAKYIDFLEDEYGHREYGKIIDDLNRVISEKNGLKLTVNESLAKALGLYGVFQMFKKSEEFNRCMNEDLQFTGKRIQEENFIAMSKKAGELKFENGCKDKVSTILICILKTWRQHIMYLNDEENRYLAELRDALLPDLMSGKIKIEDKEMSEAEALAYTE